MSLAIFKENVKRGLKRSTKAPIPRQKERRVPYSRPAIPMDREIIKVKVSMTLERPRIVVKRTKMRDLAEALKILRRSWKKEPSKATLTAIRTR